jgi:hypothetical protein
LHCNRDIDTQLFLRILGDRLERSIADCHYSF